MNAVLLIAALAACSGPDSGGAPPPTPGSAPAGDETPPLTVGRKALVEEPSLLARLQGGDKPPPPAAAFTRDQCDQLTHGGAPQGACLSGRIACGETIIGHTKGGVQRFDTKFYESKHCTPAVTDHRGGDERVYELQMPDGDHRAIITLDTPCADLDVAAMVWNDGECPSPGSIVNRCHMGVLKGNRREQVEVVSQNGDRVLVIVEGKDDEEGAFGLSVQCRPGLH